MKNNLKYLMETYNLKDIAAPAVGSVKVITPLAGGDFNSIFKLECEDKSYILKIAPSKEEKVLGYEKNIMQNEFNVTTAIKQSSRVRVPEIIHKDFSLSAIDADFLIFEYLEKTIPMSRVKLTPQERGNLMFEVGQEAAKMHSIKSGAAYGYSHMRPHPNWRDAFTVMFNGLISDADSLGAVIPYQKEVVSYVNNNLSALEEVESPVLTHFDISPSNILIDVNTKRFRGLIDAERGYFGDFAGDFIHLDYTADIEANAEFLEGYRNVRNLEITPNLRIRMNMLRLHAGLTRIAAAKLGGSNSGAKKKEGKLIIKNVMKGKY